MVLLFQSLLLRLVAVATAFDDGQREIIRAHTAGPFVRCDLPLRQDEGGP
jgi:hypothetical protein